MRGEKRTKNVTKQRRPPGKQKGHLEVGGYIGGGSQQKTEGGGGGKLPCPRGASQPRFKKKKYTRMTSTKATQRL